MNMFCSKCKQNRLPARDLTASLRLRDLLFKKKLNKAQKALKVALLENFPHSNALATHLGPKFAQNFIQKSLQTSSFMFLLLIYVI